MSAATPGTSRNLTGNVLSRVEREQAEAEFLAVAEEFLRDTVAPLSRGYTLRGVMDEEVLEGCTTLGLWAPFLPPESGGLGVSWLTATRLHTIAGRYCRSLASMMTAQAMVAWIIAAFGSPSQHERWLLDVATGRVLAGFGLTGWESGSASDVTGTRAEPDGDGWWRVTGGKRWTTSARRAGLLLTFAHSPRDGRKPGMTAFLMPTDAPGVTMTPITTMSAIPAAELGQFEFDEVRLRGEDAIVRPARWAQRAIMTPALGIGRLFVAARAAGLIQTCLDELMPHLATRIVDGEPLGDKQLVRRMVADMEAARRAAVLASEDAARRRDEGAPHAVQEAWWAKYPSAQAAVTVALNAVRLFGAAGLLTDSPVLAALLDAIGLTIIEGSEETMQDVLGADVQRGGSR